MKRTWCSSGLLAGLVLLAVLVWALPVMACDACPSPPQIGAGIGHLSNAGQMILTPAAVLPAPVRVSGDVATLYDRVVAVSDPRTLSGPSYAPPAGRMRMSCSSCTSGLKAIGTRTMDSGCHLPLRC